jgi:hypothetical protein
MQIFISRARQKARGDAHILYGGHVSLVTFLSAASLEKLTLEDLKIPATCAARKTDKNKKSKEAFKKG